MKKVLDTKLKKEKIIGILPLLDYSFDGLLLHGIYIQAACIFFRYGFVSNGNNAINVEVNASPLHCRMVLPNILHHKSYAIL